jgi:glycosyltransferase involved in cell wall biosynthesis
MSATASVIVNNFNYESFVGQAIESALDQTWPSVEVVVVDDGSTDRSRREIRRFKRKITAIMKGNGGQASCFNAGFAASSGDVVIFLDADDALLPTAVERVVELHAERSLAKVHWPLWEIAADGTPTRALRPEALLPRGDLLEQTIRLGPRSHTNPPTSGNAWSRDALAEMLPMPEAEYVICADAYLVALAPLFGEIERLLEPQSLWRRHGQNRFNSATSTIEHRVGDELWRYDHIAGVLAARLAARGESPDVAAWRKRNGGFKRLDRMRSAIHEIRRHVPEGASYVLADDGDWTTNSNWAGSEVVADRQSLPFSPPGARRGAPATAAGAIDHLEQLREAGATHVFFAWPATWWLEHHPALFEHLGASARPVIQRGNLAAFDLRVAADGAAVRAGLDAERAAQVERLKARRLELGQRQRSLAGEAAALRKAIARASAANGIAAGSRPRVPENDGSRR